MKRPKASPHYQGLLVGINQYITFQLEEHVTIRGHVALKNGRPTLVLVSGPNSLLVCPQYSNSVDIRVAE